MTARLRALLEQSDLWRRFVRWAIHPQFSEREAIRVLRSALFDAIQSCHWCSGLGYRVTAGGGRINCQLCAAWRRAICATRRT